MVEMDIKSERDLLHSALADLITFLEAYPHPMKAMISTYMKSSIKAIEKCSIGEPKDPIISDVESILRNIGYSNSEAIELAGSSVGVTAEDRVKYALSKSMKKDEQDGTN